MPSESDPSSADAAKLEFEREKWAAEVALRTRELEIREREQHRSRWSNPLVLAILAAAVAAFGNLAVSWLNGSQQLTAQQQSNRAQEALEAFKADSARLLEMIKTHDPDKAAENLSFLLEAGLITNENTRKLLTTFLAHRKPGEGPSLPAPGSVPVYGKPGPGGAGLGAYNADPTTISVSGVSAGAFMAVQVATAFSSTIRGVGVIAGGPFGCAHGDPIAATGTCMRGKPDPAALLRVAASLADTHDIDPLAALEHQKVYLFHGVNDNVVEQSVPAAIADFYAGVAGKTGQSNVFYQNTIRAGDAQVTASYGGACDATGGMFINNCGYDQAGIILQFIYGALAKRNDGALSGRLLTFDQGRYTVRDPESLDLADEGYLFVPEPCARDEVCRLHIALHGCKQNVDSVGKAYVTHAGYNEWADRNRIIVLYPQSRPMALNPFGCWDWWGFTGSDNDYLKKTGQQMASIMAMAKYVTSAFKPTVKPAEISAQTPDGLRVADVSDSAAALVWQAVPYDAQYQVYRQQGQNEPFVKVGIATGASFADHGLAPETDYSWKIVAVVDGHEGLPSGTAAARTR
jgi:poly(3-hydroxybutyrate) depolymerase